MNEKPRYMHGSCLSCTFLGYQDEYDLWICAKGSGSVCIWAYRTNEVYACGDHLIGKNTQITEAARRAVSRGLLDASRAIYDTRLTVAMAINKLFGQKLLF